jgi:hypothetical protein
MSVVGRRLRLHCNHRVTTVFSGNAVGVLLAGAPPSHTGRVSNAAIVQDACTTRCNRCDATHRARHRRSIVPELVDLTIRGAAP